MSRKIAQIRQVDSPDQSNDPSGEFAVGIIARLPDHLMKHIGELFPRQWKNSRVLPSAAAC
jgi:hypothetical protein